MRRVSVLLIAAIAVLATPAVSEQTARDYFRELYTAGGLDKEADEYVCFDGRTDLKAFFVYADYSTLEQSLMDTPEFKRLTPAQRVILNNGFLIVRVYDRGVLTPKRMFTTRIETHG